MSRLRLRNTSPCDCITAVGTLRNERERMRSHLLQRSAFAPFRRSAKSTPTFFPFRFEPHNRLLRRAVSETPTLEELRNLS